MSIKIELYVENKRNEKKKKIGGKRKVRMGGEYLSGVDFLKVLDDGDDTVGDFRFIKEGASGFLAEMTAQSDQPSQWAPRVRGRVSQ